jgi:FkbM family methyltransferase
LEQDKQATLPGVITRAQKRGFQPRSIISIGAGKGDDAPWFRRRWPEVRQLLIDVDSQFEPGYRTLAEADPSISFDICYAGAEDGTAKVEKGAADAAGAFLSATGKDVPTRRLDTLVNLHNMPAPYFLRFDTNGAEQSILEGASAVLKRTGLIMMEVYTFKLRAMNFRNLTVLEMAPFMDKLGFGVVDMCDPLYRASDGVLWQFHLFFAPLSDSLFSKTGFTD